MAGGILRRWGGAAALAGMLGGALAVGPAAAQFSLSGVRNSLVDFLLRQVSVEGAFEITAEGIEQPQDGDTQLVGLAIADADGVWFRAEAVSLSWNARRILRGEVEINRLGLTGIEVLRRPTPPEVTIEEDADIRVESFDPFAWPRSPIAVRVQDLRVTRAQIAGGVIGAQSLAFDAAGAFADEGQAQTLTVELTRTDAVAGSIALDYLRDFSDESLRLSVAADEAAGGLVAELAGLPEDAASTLRLEAEGPLADWRLRLSAEAERVLALEGALSVEAAPPLRISGHLEVRPGPELDPGASAALGDLARLDLDVTEGPDGVIRIDAARIDAPGLRLTAEGAFERATGRADLDLTLAALPPLAAAIEGVDFAELSFDGRFAGTPDAFEAEGGLRLLGLVTAPADLAEARLATRVRRDGDLIDAQIDGATEGLRLDRLTPDLLGDPRLVLRAAWDLAAGRGDLAEVLLESPLLRVGASGALDLTAETANLDYSVATPDLGPVAAAYDLDASGAFAAEGRLAGPTDAPRLTGALRLESIEAGGQALGRVRLDHDVTLAETISGQARLSAEDSPYGPAEAEARFAFADAVLTLESLTAAAMGVTAEGALTADLDGPALDGDLTVEAPDLGTLSALAGEPLAGFARADLRLAPEPRGQGARVSARLDGVSGLGAAAQGAALDVTLSDLFGAPEAQGTLTARGLAAAGAALGALSAEFSARDLTGAPEAELSASFEALSLPEAQAAVARGTLAAQGRDLIGAPALTARLTAEDLTAAEARIASVSVDLEAEDLTGAPSLTARLTADDLAAADARVARLTADVEAEDLTGAPAARLSARAETLSAGPARIAAVTLEADGRDLTGTPQGRAEVVATRLDLPDLGRFAALTLTAEGGAEALALALRGDGALAGGGPLRLRADAQAALAETPARVVVPLFDLVAGEASLALVQPLTVTLDGPDTRIDGLALRLPGGDLRGAAAVHADGLSGDLRLVLRDLAPLAGLIDAPVSAGSADLTARFDTRPASPSLRATLLAPGLRLDDAEAAGALDLSASASWAGRDLSAQAEIGGGFGDPLRVEARLPLRPGLPPAIPPGASLDARVLWTGDLARIWDLVPAPNDRLAGQVDIDLAVTGPLDALRPAGRISLTEGAYQNLQTGTILTDLTVRSDLLPGGGISLRLDARDGAEGPVEAQMDLRGTQLSARLTTDQAVLIRRDDATAAVTAAITAAGPLTAPLISGEVTIDRAEIRLIGGGGPSVPDLGEVEIKGEPVPEAPEAGDGGPRLDLRIRAPRDIWVRGRGLDSEWEMDLAVTGPAAAPRITGAVERRRGRLDFLGRDFALERGRIAFFGGPEIDPDIDVMLQHERADITGRIVVRGPASAPEIAFESSPALPEDEVLPRVLFGVSRQSLNAAQAIQLAGGIATLLQGGEGRLGALRSAAGLDVLAVDTGGDDTAVRLGRNVADGVYVGVRQPIDGGETTVQVEVEVLDNVTVDTETGGATGTSVGVNWRYDW